MGSGPKYTTASREEILGEPLTEEEVKELINGSLRVRRQLNMGRDGLTHNMLDNIHAHWKRRRVCKIKCIGVCTVDMDNVRQQLEEKTGGKVIYNRGGVIFLFRGRNYNYRTRPRFPLMLWKPVTPVYPRLVQRVPEGLTPEEATEMRKKGHKLPPICKLGKNGLYSNLAQHVREAFEECELVRVNCKGLNKSDYRKIGAKLKDLVPCILLSFSYEHILVWRGKDWKSSLPPPEDNHNEVVQLVADGPTIMTSPRITDSLLNNQEIVELGAGNCSNGFNLEMPIEIMRPVEDVGIGETEDSSSLVTEDQPLALPSTDPIKMTDNEDDSSVVVVDQRPLIVIHQETPASFAGTEEDSCLLIPSQSISLNQGPDLEESEDLPLPESEPQLLPASSVGLTWIENDEAVTRRDDIESADGLEMIPTATASLQCESAVRSGACLDGVLLLLRQAVDSGSAVVLDDECSLDANIVYKRSVALAKTAPPGPVFRHRIRKAAVQKTQKEKGGKYEEQNVDVDVDVEVVAASEKRGNETKNSRSRRREDLREVPSDVVPHGSLKVDELAKLLA